MGVTVRLKFNANFFQEVEDIVGRALQKRLEELAQKAANDLARKLVEEAKRSFETTPGGRGQPPAVQTGNLRGSLRARVVATRRFTGGRPTPGIDIGKARAGALVVLNGSYYGGILDRDRSLRRRWIAPAAGNVGLRVVSTQVASRYRGF